MLIGLVQDSGSFFIASYRWDVPINSPPLQYHTISKDSFFAYLNFVREMYCRKKTMNALKLIRMISDRTQVVKHMRIMLYRCEDFDNPHTHVLDEDSSMSKEALNTFTLIKQTIWTCVMQNKTRMNSEKLRIDLRLLLGLMQEVASQVEIADFIENKRQCCRQDGPSFLKAPIRIEDAFTQRENLNRSEW